MKNLDKCLIFSNLVVTTKLVTMTKIKPLIQLREMIAAALSSMTNLSKTFEKFIICPLPPNSEQRLPSKSEQLKIICKGYRLALLVVERGEAERNGEQGQPAAFRSPYY